MYILTKHLRPANFTNIADREFSLLRASISEALRFLGQDPNGDLTCVYCGHAAQTWDHLVSLVKAGQLQGFGHQLGNLVPSCKTCNSAKGSKDFTSFISTYLAITSDRAALISRLTEYQQQFASPVYIARLHEMASDQWTRYSAIKQQIFDLMKEADVLAQDVVRDKSVLTRAP